MVLFLLPSVFGSLTVSVVQYRINYRPCLIISNYVQLMTIFVLLSDWTTVDCERVPYMSTILLGFITGFVVTVTAMYISEICEPTLRGPLICVTNAFYIFGFVIRAMHLKKIRNEPQWKIAFIILLLTVLSLVNALALFVLISTNLEVFQHL